MIKQVSYGKLAKSSNAKRENEFPSRKPNKSVETVRIASLFTRAESVAPLDNMGKRKAKKRSNSTLKVTSYFKRFQVKFTRRREGEYRDSPGRDPIRS